MKTLAVTFENESGRTLEGRLEMPTGKPPTAYAIFAHCFTCSKNIRAAVIIARALAAKGIATLRFDFTGLGQSEGEFSESTFSSDTKDIEAAARFLKERYLSPQILIGHSLGGSAVLFAASAIPSVTSVVTIAAPFDPLHVSNLFTSASEEIETQGEAEVLLAGRAFKIKKSFLEDLKEHDSSKTLAELNAAVLVMHSPTDTTVPIDNAAKIYTAARHPKSFVTLDPADHLLSQESDARYAGTLIAAWAERYLDVSESNLPPEENVVVAQTGLENFYTEIMANTHSLIADEPKSVGGTELGPTPYDYLMAGLAACTTMTLRMYADKKEIALSSVRVRISHSKIHAQDCKHCETTEGKIDTFTRVLELEGSLTEAQRKRMLEIAEKCPVHRTLHSEIQIETTLKE